MRLVNCHDGQHRARPFRQYQAEPGLARPTVTPQLPTIFDALALTPGSTAVALPNELAGLHAEVRDRLLHGASPRSRRTAALPPLARLRSARSVRGRLR